MRYILLPLAFLGGFWIGEIVVDLQIVEAHKECSNQIDYIKLQCQQMVQGCNK